MRLSFKRQFISVIIYLPPSSLLLVLFRFEMLISATESGGGHKPQLRIRVCKVNMAGADVPGVFIIKLRASDYSASIIVPWILLNLV